MQPAIGTVIPQAAVTGAHRADVLLLLLCNIYGVSCSFYQTYPVTHTVNLRGDLVHIERKLFRFLSSVNLYLYRKRISVADTVFSYFKIEGRVLRRNHSARPSSAKEETEISNL